MLQILGDLAYRPHVQNELQPRYNKIIILLEKELETVKYIFNDGMKVSFF